MADRVERLREAAQARHQATLRRAESTLQRMAKRGDPVTFNRVADTARVSRSWLYRQPTLRREIDRLRDASATQPGVLPSAERASTDSLRQQVHTYREEITRLRSENQELREQLARHLGAARAATVTQPSQPPSKTCTQQETCCPTTDTA